MTYFGLPMTVTSSHKEAVSFASTFLAGMESIAQHYLAASEVLPFPPSAALNPGDPNVPRHRAAVSRDLRNIVTEVGRLMRHLGYDDLSIRYGGEQTGQAHTSRHTNVG